MESAALVPSVVKIMEKGSHVFVVDNLSARSVGMGKSIDSRPFVVGGYSFIIQVYPDGGNPYSHSHGNVSLFVKNVSPKPAQVVYDFFILGRSGFDLGYSTYDRTDIYHQVYYVPPGTTFGLFHFVHRSSIPTYCLQNDCIMIRANIGVVLDHPPMPMPMPSLAIAPSSSERCILFQVGDSRYYALESLVTARCPALLSDYPKSNNSIVVVSDVNARVFTAVLWFLCNGMLCLYDRQAVGDSKDSFGVELLAAADRLKFKDLRSECRLAQLFFGGFEAKKKIWRKLCSWLEAGLHPQLVKED